MPSPYENYEDKAGSIEREEGGDEYPETEPAPAILSRAQKFFALGLISLGFFTLLFGFFQFQKNLKSPFIPSLNQSKEVPKEDPLKDSFILSLKDKDTDKDGLADYDELYLYQTSPYLADSDSDGYNDKQELDSNNDPNCPKGKDCSEKVFDLKPKEDQNSQIIQSFLGLVPGLSQESGFTQDQQKPEGNESNLNTQELRQVLINQGISEDLLNQIDDKTLMDTFQEVMGKAEEKSGPAEKSNKEQSPILPPISERKKTSSSGQAGSIGSKGRPMEPIPSHLPSSAQNKELSVEEIRNILKQGGASEELLSQIDDETLKRLYRESVK